MLPTSKQRGVVLVEIGVEEAGGGSEVAEPVP